MILCFCGYFSLYGSGPLAPPPIPWFSGLSRGLAHLGKAGRMHDARMFCTDHSSPPDDALQLPPQANLTGTSSGQKRPNPNPCIHFWPGSPSTLDVGWYGQENHDDAIVMNPRQTQKMVSKQATIRTNPMAKSFPFQKFNICEPVMVWIFYLFIYFFARSF